MAKRRKNQIQRICTKNMMRMTTTTTTTAIMMLNGNKTSNNTKKTIHTGIGKQRARYGNMTKHTVSQKVTDNKHYSFIAQKPKHTKPFLTHHTIAKSTDTNQQQQQQQS